MVGSRLVTPWWERLLAGKTLKRLLEIVPFSLGNKSPLFEYRLAVRMTRIHCFLLQQL